MKANGGFRILNNNIYIQISYEDLAAIRHIVNIAPKEAQWFHRLEKIQEGQTTIYRIYEMYIPEQYCSGAEVESDPEMMVKFYRELVEEHGNEKANDILGNLTVWCHSHHTMGVNPSGQDNKQFQELIKNATDAKVTLPQIMFIFNKSDNYYSRIWDPESGVLCENIPILIETPAFDEISAQAKIKFKKKPVKAKWSQSYKGVPARSQGLLDWHSDPGIAFATQTHATGHSGSKKKHKVRQKQTRKIQAVSSSTKEINQANAEMIEELGEKIALTNSCHHDAETLVSFLSDIMTENEFCIYELLLNGTESELRELEDSVTVYSHEDQNEASFDLYECFVDQYSSGKLLSIAYEVATKLSDLNASPEYSEQLIDFWLDAYASTLGGQLNIEETLDMNLLQQTVEGV